MGRARAGGVDELLRETPGVERHGQSLRISFMYRRQRCRETLSIPATVANVRYAARLRTTIQHEIQTGQFDYAKHFPDSPRAVGSATVRDIPVKDLYQRYWDIKIADITDGTERRYKNALDVVCRTLGNDKRVKRLMPEDIDRLRSELIATRKPGTVNHYLACWNGMAAWAVKNGYTDRDLQAEFFQNEPEEPDPLSLDEYRSIVQKGCLHAQDVALVTLAVYTGLRPGELCALAREDVQGRTLRVRRALNDKGRLKITKTGKERTIYLMPPAQQAAQTLLEITKDMKAKDETVQISRHQSRTETITPLVPPIQAKNNQGRDRMQVASWRTKWGILLKRAGVRHRVAYQTRHTYACWSLTAHGNIAFIAKQMGHKDYSMLVSVYGRWMESESESEADFVWEQMQKSGAFCPL